MFLKKKKLRKGVTIPIVHTANTKDQTITRYVEKSEEAKQDDMPDILGAVLVAEAAAWGFGGDTPDSSSPDSSISGGGSFGGGGAEGGNSDGSW